MKRIALLSKHAPIHSLIAAGFLAQAQDYAGRFVIEQYHTAKLNWQLATQKAHIIIESQPDAVITIGAMCSQVMQQTIETTQSDLPQFFIGVTDPQYIGLVDSSEGRNGNITGMSFGHPSHLTAAEILLFLKPTIKSILLPYNPFVESGSLTNAAQLIKAFFKNRQVSVIPLPIYQDSNLYALLSQKLPLVDTVMLLDGCPINELTTQILPLLKEANVTLFAGTLEAVAEGAAFGWGACNELLGTEAFTYFSTIMRDNEPFQNYPIVFLKNAGRQLGINEQRMTEQGIALDEKILYFLKHSSLSQPLPFYGEDQYGVRP